MRFLQSSVATSLILLFLILGWFGQSSVSALGKTTSKNVKTDDVSHWLVELEKRLPDKPKAQKTAAVQHSNSVHTPNATPVGIKAQPSGKEAIPTVESPMPPGQEMETHHEGGGPTSHRVARISVDFYKIDLHNVFRLLGKVSGKNIVVDEDVKGSLTLALDNVPWTFVLEVIKNLKGLSSLERYNTIMIYPSDKKITWAGDSDTTGTLDMETHSIQVDTRPGGITVNKISSSTIPADDIIKADKLIQQAGQEEKRGNIYKAWKLIQKAAIKWPDNAQLQLKAGTLALKSEDELAAYNFGKAALKLSPQNCQAATLVAISLARMGRDQQARAYFERALAVSSKPPLLTLWNYAVFCFSHGDYRDSLRLANRIATNFSLTPDVIMLRARIYEQLSYPKKALEEYRTIVNGGKDIPFDMIRYAKAQIKKLAGQKGLAE